MTARAWWKMYWRALRIARREARKATHDLIVYGTGIVDVGKDAKPDGVAQHIPFPLVRWGPFTKQPYGRAPWDNLP